MSVPESSPYDHRHHAGNAGDVWKHIAWLAALASYKREKVEVLDTHAGRGTYPLTDRGAEWGQGVLKLREAYPDGVSGSGAVDRYLARLAKTPGTYPGSATLTMGMLGRSDRLVAYEKEPATAAALRLSLGHEPRATVRPADGWTAPELSTPGPRLVLIDPPYSDKEDWTRAADATAAAWAAGHAVVLWYPIKRWSRPNLLLQRLRELGVASVALDLTWTPLELEKRVMVGAGVVFVRIAKSVIHEQHAAAPVVGGALATHEGRWSLRVTAYG